VVQILQLKKWLSHWDGVSLFQAGQSGQGPDIPPSLRGIKKRLSPLLGVNQIWGRIFRPGAG
jgi:hypothetical protein